MIIDAWKKAKEQDEIWAEIAEINEKLEALRMAVDEIRRGGNEK